MTDINNNIVETQKTAEEIRKERRKEYMRNYQKEYIKNHPEYRQKQRESKAKSNRKRYEEDPEYREKARDYSKFYKFQKKVEIKEKLAKLELLEKILGNNIDIENSKISIKA